MKVTFPSNLTGQTRAHVHFAGCGCHPVRFGEQKSGAATTASSGGSSPSKPRPVKTGIASLPG